MKSIALLFFTFLCLHANAQKEALCYGKATMPSVYVSTLELYPVFIGSDTDADYLKRIDITLEPAKMGLVEKLNENCLSPNPEDCMMICEVVIPAKVQQKYIVMDTSKTVDYLWENLTIESLVKEGGYEEYVTVICNEKIDEEFIAQISQVLFEKQYYGGGINKIFSKALKDALVQYQIDNNFPQGQLDLVTLNALGFGYTK